MNIVVCLKIAPDAEDLEIGNDGSVSIARAEWTIGGFDLPALEAGVRLAEMHGDKVIALSVGSPAINQSKVRKDILSRGAEELVLVMDESLRDASTAETAQVLTAAIRKLGDVQLVLFGEGSADLYFQQTGVQVGERLGWVSLNAVRDVQWIEEGMVRVQRALEQEIQVLDVPLPAALSVTSDICEPRLASMREILRASKKPVFEWSLADVGIESLTPSVEILNIIAPPRTSRKGEILNGSVQEAVSRLVNILRKDGVL
ncbi:MAG: putative electron transfer flavoprotein FixA [Bellilinea sp.]|nr:putative electron transfer flavoprotein FixA [Bellilinea sp.]